MAQTRTAGAWKVAEAKTAGGKKRSPVLPVERSPALPVERSPASQGKPTAGPERERAVEEKRAAAPKRAAGLDAGRRTAN